jgi:hypothetical protein
MVYQTDERLKSFLDTNQLARERLCLAVLAIDSRFTNVKPRHPRGGPDGARDIDANFLNVQHAFGAVGFVNQANDSDEQKKRATGKFKVDLEAALAVEPTINVFVFFTNVNLTVKEKSDLVNLSQAKGLSNCEIFDRERIRIVLDSADGFSIRFQYLQIPLSEAEQATFFAKWGDDIQEVISEGFGKLEGVLKRLQFLAETNLPLDVFSVAIELDREYAASEIGHFRAFCSLELREPKNRILGYVFGETDDPNRHDAKSVDDLDLRIGGIGQGRCGKSWEERIIGDNVVPDPFSEEGRVMGRTSDSVSIGLQRVRTIVINFGSHGLFRVLPYLLLRDVDEARLAFFLNRSLADKLKAVQVYGNEYKLAEYSREIMRIDRAVGNFEIPLFFAEEELADEWVRVMHDLSPFRVSFSERTPLRVYPAIEIPGP